MRAYGAINLKPRTIKRAVATGLLALAVFAGSAGFGAANIACDCQTTPDDPPINGNGPVEPEYNEQFTYSLTVIQPQDPDLADTLIELYKEEEEVATNLSALYLYNPELVKFVTEQPWFSDSLSLEEEIFINHGLGSHPNRQGVGSHEGKEEVLKEIIENHQYKIETIQLRGGEKNILIMCEDPQYINLAMEKTKESMPLIEQFLGITYPSDTLTVYIAEDIFTGGSNGTISLETLYLTGRISALYHEGVHAMWQTTQDGGVGGGTKFWINEGIAVLGAYLVGEQLNSTISLQEKYEIELRKVQREGWLNVNAYTKGLIILKELRDIIGHQQFSNMLREIYVFKEPFSDFAVSEEKLEEYALKYVIQQRKAQLQQLFDEKVWGE